MTEELPLARITVLYHEDGAIVLDFEQVNTKELDIETRAWIDTVIRTMKEAYANLEYNIPKEIKAAI